MQRIVKLLVAVGLLAALSGCVVAPPARGYVRVGVVAPVVVYPAGYYYRRW
jgi:hypothetical protein